MPSQVDQFGRQPDNTPERVAQLRSLARADRKLAAGTNQPRHTVDSLITRAEKCEAEADRMEARIQHAR